MRRLWKMGNLSIQSCRTMHSDRLRHAQVIGNDLLREFVIPISGFVTPDPLLEQILSPTSPKLVTPSVHVIGSNDVIVIPERSQVLVDLCEEEKARVERHEGGSCDERALLIFFWIFEILIAHFTGHFVPSKASWRNFFKEYLINADGNRSIASPSEQASRSATPL